MRRGRGAIPFGPSRAHTRLGVSPFRLAALVAGALILSLAPTASAHAETDVEPDAPDEQSAESGAPNAEARDEQSAAAPSDRAATRPRRSAPPPPVGTRFPEPLEGESFRIRYQFRRAKLQGMLLADRDARPGYVRNHLYLPYTQTPRALDVTTHLVELDYAPHPRTTLVVQVPFIQKDLETIEGASGYRRRDETEGVGDVNFALVVPFIRKGRESSHVHIAFDVPNGSIRKEDRDGRRLPYDSQIGNGTVDFEWGWTYRGEMDWLSWGGQAIGRHPIDKNGLGYREGSRFEASLWSGMRLFDGLSASLRVQWQKQNNLRGRDRGFDPIVNPAENGKARGGTTFLVGPGLAYDLPGIATGQRLALELAVPVYQNVDGPQLEQDWVLTTGWQWTF